ncbi:MAG TPA: DNA replication and repair protein RecF [bacterium]|nr:DNA replication and repair protein RecF [bacterium]
MIEKISIRNFRNLEQVAFTPRETTVLCGNNAQGKTSILEAIHFLLCNQSHRQSSLKEIVRIGQQFCRIDLLIGGTSGRSVSCRVFHDQQTGRFKKIYFDAEVKKTFTSIPFPCTAVLICPEDIRLFTGPPSRRRDLLDRLSNMQDRQYHRDILAYERALRNRNTLLVQQAEHKRKIDPHLFDLYTEQLLESGAAVWEKRLVCLAAVQPLFAQALEKIWPSGEKPVLSYHPSILSKHTFKTKQTREQLKQLFKDALQSQKERERVMGSTLFGPHRDDIECRLQGMDARKRASQGELKATSFCLKAAEALYAQSLYPLPPIILLDDVFSEFDEQHRQAVSCFFQKQQVFITTTDRGFIPAPLDQKAQIFTLINGSLQEQV